MICDNLEEWDGGNGKEATEGGDICMHRADSYYCTGKTNTTLQNKYTPIKKNSMINHNRNEYEKKIQYI